jgi:hypothetical protein
MIARAVGIWVRRMRWPVPRSARRLASFVLLLATPPMTSHCLHQHAVPPVSLPRQELGDYGWLGTEVRQVRRPNCWTLVLRGRFHNPYDEPVHGVSLIVRLRGAGESPRELERLQSDLRLEIDPRQIRDLRSRDPNPVYEHLPGYLCRCVRQPPRRGRASRPLAGNRAGGG